MNGGGQTAFADPAIMGMGSAMPNGNGHAQGKGKKKRGMHVNGRMANISV